jgi:hypothetical protein
MSTHLFRDTTFGRLVRLLSANKVFQYPDEQDATLHTQSFNSPSNRPTHGPGYDQQKLEDFGNQTMLPLVNNESKNDNGPHEQPGSTESQPEQDVILVHWYGKKDFEVRSGEASSTGLILMLQLSRIPITGRAVISSWSRSRSACSTQAFIPPAPSTSLERPL